jgi:DNA-binding transcriptional MocR family regulator
MEAVIKRKFRPGSLPGIGLRVRFEPHQVGYWLHKLGELVGTDSSAWKAASALATAIGDDGRLDPTKQWIAVKTGVCEKTVSRALGRLAKLGFLTWHRRTAVTEGIQHQTSNAYQLRFPEGPPPSREVPESYPHTPPVDVSLNRIDSSSSVSILSDTPPAPPRSPPPATAAELLRAMPVRLLRKAQGALASRRDAVERMLGEQYATRLRESGARIARPRDVPLARGA